MGRRRIENRENLPPGVYRHGRQYRAREYRYTGDGRLRGYWKVIGRTLEDVARFCPNGEIPPPEPEMTGKLRASLCQRFTQIKLAAKKRGLAFDLTRDDVKKMAAESNGRCAVTGIPFEYVLPQDAPFRRNPFGPSIDRIDSRNGYVLGNVRLVCAMVNVAMMDWGEGYLWQIAHAMVSKRKGVA